MKVIFLIFIFLVISACGRNGRDREFYGNIDNSPGSYPLVDPAEHAGGWGRPQCLVCHNVGLNVHRGPYALNNADALNEAIRNNGLEAYCLICHGNNGIEP